MSCGTPGGWTPRPILPIYNVDANVRNKHIANIRTNQCELGVLLYWEAEVQVELLVQADKIVLSGDSFLVATSSRIVHLMEREI